MAIEIKEFIGDGNIKQVKEKKNQIRNKQVAKAKKITKKGGKA